MKKLVYYSMLFGICLLYSGSAVAPGSESYGGGNITVRVSKVSNDISWMDDMVFEKYRISPQVSDTVCMTKSPP